MPGYPCCCGASGGDCADCTSTPQQFSVTYSGTTIPSADCTESECESFLGTYTLEKNHDGHGNCSWGGTFEGSYIDTYDTFGFVYICDTCTASGLQLGIVMRLWRVGSDFRLTSRWGCVGGTDGYHTQAVYVDQWSKAATVPFNCETYSETFTFDAGTNLCGYDDVTVLVEGI